VTSDQVGSLLAGFAALHGPCIRRAAGRRWSDVTFVPSSRDDEREPHPLLTAAGRVGLRMAQTLCRGPGPLDAMTASDDGYRVVSEVEGRALLLVEDVFDSGARLQSAASALQLAGADVVAAVTVTRVVDPERGTAVQDLLARATAAEFDFGECCLEHLDGPPA
jgi:hypothetical protein